MIIAIDLKEDGCQDHDVVTDVANEPDQPVVESDGVPTLKQK
jgi:hypothetical protein